MTSPNGWQADRQTADTQDEATRRHTVAVFPALCMSVVNSAGDIISSVLGEAYAEISGYQVEELEADPSIWLNAVHPADRDRIRRAYQSLASGGTLHEHYRIFRRDGQMRYVMETGVAGTLGVAARPVIRWLIACSPAQATPESAICFRELVEEAPIGISARDLGGRVLYCNPAYAKLFGYESPESMIGTNFRDIMSPTTLAEFRKRAFPRILEGAWSGEVEVQRTDGQLLQIRLSTNVFRGPDGTPVAAYALVLDITELKSTEKALRESRELLESVQNAIPANIAAIDANGTIVAVNERWRRFALENGDPSLSRTCEGINYLDVCRRAKGKWSEGAEQALEGISAILRGMTQDFEMEYPCPSPHARRWFFMRASCLEGEQRGAVIAHFDITRRKRAEEALRTSEELLHRRYDAMSAGMLVLDRSGRVVQVNKMASTILGMPAEAMLGTTMAEPIWRAIREDGSALPAEELPAVRTLRTGQPTRGTRIGFFCGRHETCRWVTVNSEPIFDETTGEVKEAMIAFLDITESKRIEEALRESEARYHSLLENLDAVVFRIDGDMRLLAVSGRVKAFLEYDRDELLANPSLWRNVVYPDDMPRAMELMRVARETRSPQCVEVRIVRRSGATSWIRGTLTPIFDEKGDFLYYDGVSIDINERVEAQQRDARHTNRMRVLTETSQKCASTFDLPRILETVTQQVCIALDSVTAGINIDPVSGRLLNLSLCCPHGCDVRKLDEGIRDADLSVEKVFGMMGARPRIIPDLSRSSPTLAHCAERAGLRHGMIAPVTAGEEVVGVLLAARHADEQFDEEDLWFLSEMASHTSAALANSALYGKQAKIAETLQRTLIPAEPAIGFLDIATLYAPSPGDVSVGGDFFDLFRLNGRLVGLVVGDVSGKGVEAAVHTAEAKYMLRAFAHQHPDPLHVVTALNAALFDYLPTESFITLVYFLIDVDTHRMSYVNAGHETSLVLCREEQVIREIGPSGPMLGVTSSVGYTKGWAVLEPDDYLFCYTDGLVDVRTNGDRYGFARLKKTLALSPGEDAKQLMDSVMNSVQGCGAAKQTDDQVVVIVRPLV